MAVHWDGYPQSLGEDLHEAGANEQKILEASMRHSIDSCSDLLEVAGAGDIEEYGDFAEYQYDLRGDEWHFRSLSGEWPKSAKAADKKKNKGYCLLKEKLTELRVKRGNR